ncbi:MAG: bifunctional 4-hydroxy-2-oxoglutarate aldolase/2-dehydro-3-deoxy-phosphogluconate aldolase [Promethearchaeota archaeon]
MNILKRIEELKIVPVIVIEKIEDVVPLGTIFENEGLPIAEITFRTSVATEAIRILRKEFPNMIIGAGTVLTVENIKAAVKAGTQFIVTPGYNPIIIDYCNKNKITICPGLNNPSFVEWGLERGLTYFKFYPAEISGGPKMLKAMAGPYPNAKFLPTGGINNQNLIDYLELPNVFACGGSWLCPKELISINHFDIITEKVKEAVNLVKKEIK